MTISTTIVKNSYAGNGATTVFNYNFKILSSSDLKVIIRSSTGTETTKTLNTHYTLTGVGSAGGGSITFTAGNIPTSGQTIVLIRDTTQTQSIDYVANDPFPAETHEEGLDKGIILAQELQEEVDRCIKLSRTNAMTSTEFTVGAADRANKILAFDATGEIAVTQELGTYRGNWLTATSYAGRDLVKDTSNNNIYYVNTAHTSSGSQPLSSNANSSYYTLIVDAAAATTSATNAATSAAAALASQNAASGSASAASSSASAASSSASSASSSASAASSSAASAASSFDDFDDRYLGSKSSAPSLDNDGNALINGALYWNSVSAQMFVRDSGAWVAIKPTTVEQGNITTVAGISGNITTVAGISANVTSVAGNSSNINSVASNSANINTVATNNANINTVAGANANITTVAGISGAISSVASNASNISTVATDIAKVITAANDLNEATSEIEVVANAIANVDTVGTNIANVNLVGGSIANVNTVASNIGTVNDFAARYRVSATAPSTSLDLGDLYFDTTSNTMKVYSSGGFINAGSSVNGTANRFKYTATASQTTFTGADANGNTLAYDAGFLDVYLNGIKLVNGSDFTASSGSSIVLATGASASDILEVIAYGTFQLANFSIADANDVPPLGTAGQVLKVNSGATALEYGTVDLANLSATSLTSGTLPDARFPATLPATSGANLTSLNASNLSSGTVSTARLGSGTADATTYLRGDNSWQTISTSPEQLVKSIPLASGASVTAGKLLSIGSSGEIVPLPTLNTFGTTRTNAIATGYNVISTTGDTAIRYSQTFSGGYMVVTFVGIAMSNSANPTTGGTTVTYANGFGSGVGVAVYPITSTKFLINTAYTYNICCYGSGGNSTLFIINVDPITGNCTKGNELSLGGAVSMSISTGTITKDLFVSRMNSTYQIIRNTTGNTIAGTSDADALDWVAADLKNSIRTTNNILGIGIGATWRVATYTPGTPAIGTKTDTTQIADYQSDGQWAKMGLASTDDAEYMIVTYTNTSSVGRYITYSVNQTTGALTQVETGLQSLLNSTGASAFRFKDKNSFVGTNASFAFTNGAKNSSFINTPYTLGTMRYNSGDLFYSFDTAFGGYPTNTGYTVNAYGTNPFNYIGVAKTTDSTSPVDVVTDGVAAGFTSLTPGTIYYSSNPADGNVTTSSSSGILVGKAISSTEILLQRSNSQ